MNHDIEITQLDLVAGGNVIRQGHHFTLDFTPRGENGDVIALTGKDIYAVFYDKNGIRYEGAASYISSDAVIRVEITENIGHGTMWIEFTATDPNDAAYKKKFPARENNARISITPSTDDLSFVGVKSITVEQLRNEQTVAQQEFEADVLPRVETVESQQAQLAADYQAAAGALTKDSEVVLARGDKPTLGARLDDTAVKLAETFKRDETGVLRLNAFTEEDRAVIQGLAPGEINAVLGEGNVKPFNTDFMIQTGVGKNSFNEEIVTIVPDKIPNGGLVENATGGVSFLIPVEPNTPYTLSRQVAGTRFRAGYTNTDTLVSLETPVYNYTANDAGSSITLPANPNGSYIFCYFWRVPDQGTFTNTSLASVGFQLEEGNVATAYEPFKNLYQMKKEHIPIIEPVKQPINKKVSILGDSISTFDGFIPAGNRARYPQADLLTDVNETWWKRLINETGMTLGINDSWAGSRVSWDGVSESTDIGIDKHMASQTRINKLDDNGVPDVIFFFGGTNDAGADVTIGAWDGTDLTTSNVSTLSDAYSTTLKRLQTAYPNAKVIAISPMYTTSYYPSTRLNVHVEKMKFIADFYGATFVDLRKCGITIYNRATYLPDGIHPNAAGMELMFKYILSQTKEVLTS